MLAVAEELFTSQSFRTATIRDIAIAAGVSVGTVMGVGDKDTLLVTVLEQQIRRVHASRMREPNTITGTTPEPVTAIVELVRPFIDMFTLDPTLSREYAAILTRGTHRSQIFSELAAFLVEEIASVLRYEGFDDDHARTTAHTIHLSYLGLLFVWAASGKDENTSFFDDLRTVIHSLLSYRLRNEKERY